MKSVIIHILFLLFALCTFQQQYLSGEFIYDITSISKIHPQPTNCWGLPCETFIWGTQETKPVSAAYTCLGYVGPIGSLGPLGAWGPLGDGTYSPEKIFKLMGNWETIRRLILVNGPLDHPKGPLSSSGPLGETFWTLMPKINDFTMHMQGYGVWSVLGPIGPLGALGGLGPLGPVGAHGYNTSNGGDYLDKSGKIVKTVQAKWDENSQVTWPLFEKYTSKRSSELSDKWELDTSFMTLSSVGLESKTYNIQSNQRQFITINIVPFQLNNQFTLEILNEKGDVIGSSKSIKVMNWIQVFVNPGKYKIKVTGTTLNCANLFCVGNYYLYVVGSTIQMIRHPHINYRYETLKK